MNTMVGTRMEQRILEFMRENGIAVLTIEEQQLIFRRLSKESYQMFRQKQRRRLGSLPAAAVPSDLCKVSHIPSSFPSFVMCCHLLIHPHIDDILPH